MTEPTDEMKAAVKRRMGIPDGVELDPWMDAAIGDVLDIVARDNEVRPYCNEVLMPGVVCKRMKHVDDAGHYAVAPGASGVSW
jgi:hypothetical protein